MPPLSAGGIATMAAPLTLTTFAGDVQAVERILECAPGVVVLVGQAHAGAMIGATRNENVRGLVYVAALAPEKGGVVAALFHRIAPLPRSSRLSPDTHGLVSRCDAAFASTSAQHTTAGALAVLVVAQRRKSPACITAAMPRPLWKGRRNRYLLAEQDRMIVEDNRRSRVERMGAKVRAHAVNHAPIATVPALVLNVLREAVSAIRSDAAR